MPRWAETRARQSARGDDRLDAGAATPGRCLYPARGAGAAGLRLDRDLPDRRLYAARRATGGGRARPACRVSAARRASSIELGNEVPAGTAGEVVVRGPNVFVEYWGNSAASREALREGWYHTGDIGTRDADGHFFIHDRKKNMIISGGENIYPAEVERVLTEHPAIAEAAVIGRAGSRSGRRCRSPTSLHARAQVAKWRRSNAFVWHSSHATRCRAHTFCVDSLPRNAMGKVQHFRLKQQAAAAAKAQWPDTEQS